MTGRSKQFNSMTYGATDRRDIIFISAEDAERLQLSDGAKSRCAPTPAQWMELFKSPR